MPRYLDDGGWIPIDRRLVAALPRRRPYSEAEAMLSISLDLFNGEERCVREYARLWHWGRERVWKYVQKYVHGKPVQTDSGPEKFSYVAHFPRLQGQSLASTSSEATKHESARGGYAKPRASAKPGTSERKKRESKNGQKPVHRIAPEPDLSKLEALLADRGYLARLVRQSPVLAAWTLDEIAAWSRIVVAKGNAARQQRRERPIQSFPHYLGQCVRRVRAYERPRAPGCTTAPAVMRAAEGMGL